MSTPSWADSALCDLLKTAVASDDDHLADGASSIAQSLRDAKWAGAPLSSQATAGWPSPTELANQLLSEFAWQAHQVAGSQAEPDGWAFTAPTMDFTKFPARFVATIAKFDAEELVGHVYAAALDLSTPVWERECKLQLAPVLVSARLMKQPLGETAERAIAAQADAAAAAATRDPATISPFTKQSLERVASHLRNLGSFLPIYGQIKCMKQALVNLPSPKRKPRAAVVVRCTVKLNVPGIRAFARDWVREPGHC